MGKRRRSNKGIIESRRKKIRIKRARRKVRSGRRSTIRKGSSINH